MNKRNKRNVQRIKSVHTAPFKQQFLKENGKGKHYNSEEYSERDRRSPAPLFLFEKERAICGRSSRQADQLFSAFIFN